jgi:hypothetical protein
MWKQLLFANAIKVSSAESSIYSVSSFSDASAEPGLAFISYSIELSSFPDFAGNVFRPFLSNKRDATNTSNRE